MQGLGEGSGDIPATSKKHKLPIAKHQRRSPPSAPLRLEGDKIPRLPTVSGVPDIPDVVVGVRESTRNPQLHLTVLPWGTSKGSVVAAAKWGCACHTLPGLPPVKRAPTVVEQDLLRKPPNHKYRIAHCDSRETQARLPSRRGARHRDQGGVARGHSPYIVQHSPLVMPPYQQHGLPPSPRRRHHHEGLPPRDRRRQLGG
mmetsp:Transcript_3913/g.8296  ORF Transcript_3913/g.8296 Transcript_3913/m.8296 type:complete len:200 (+) Transcript_3913:778-1377(+)